MPSDETLAPYYERYYTHDQPAGRNQVLAALWPLPRRRLAQRRAATYFRASPGGRALEVGCGAGERLIALADQGWAVTGQDIDPKAGRLVAGSGIPILRGRLADLALGPESFDLIGLSHVIEHTSRPEALLSECWRLLAPGGELVVVAPNATSFGRRLFGRRWQNLHAPFHVAIPGPRSLPLLAVRTGLPANPAVSVATHSDYVGVDSFQNALFGRKLPAPLSAAVPLIGGVAFQMAATPVVRLRPHSGPELVWRALKPSRRAEPLDT
jgi:SAM-dependent methyltransferase